MNTAGIVQYPQSVLLTKCDPVVDFESDEWKRVSYSLFKAGWERGRVGVAAPQIGFSVCAFVARVPEKEGKPRMFANCRVVSADGEQRGREGCLSVAERWFTISRANFVSLVAQDESGIEFSLNVTGIDARAIQHECDHLEGILIVDRAYEQSRELPRQLRRVTERELAKVPYYLKNTLSEDA